MNLHINLQSLLTIFLSRSTRPSIRIFLAHTVFLAGATQMAYAGSGAPLMGTGKPAVGNHNAQIPGLSTLTGEITKTDFENHTKVLIQFINQIILEKLKTDPNVSVSTFDILEILNGLSKSDSQWQENLNQLKLSIPQSYFEYLAKHLKEAGVHQFRAALTTDDQLKHELSKNLTDLEVLDPKIPRDSLARYLNQRASEKTAKLVSQLVTPELISGPLYLGLFATTALDFVWEHPFLSEEPAPFTTQSGAKINALMMDGTPQVWAKPDTDRASMNWLAMPLKTQNQAQAYYVVYHPSQHQAQHDGLEAKTPASQQNISETGPALSQPLFLSQVTDCKSEHCNPAGESATSPVPPKLSQVPVQLMNPGQFMDQKWLQIKGEKAIVLYPNVNLERNELDLIKILPSLGFQSAQGKFARSTSHDLRTWMQSNQLTVNKMGVRAISVTQMMIEKGGDPSLKKYQIDGPHASAVTVQLPNGVYFPIFLNYISSPPSPYGFLGKSAIADLKALLADKNNLTQLASDNALDRANKLLEDLGINLPLVQRIELTELLISAAHQLLENQSKLPVQDYFYTAAEAYLDRTNECKKEKNALDERKYAQKALDYYKQALSLHFEWVKTSERAQKDYRSGQSYTAKVRQSLEYYVNAIQATVDAQEKMSLIKEAIDTGKRLLFLDRNLSLIGSFFFQPLFEALSEDTSFTAAERQEWLMKSKLGTELIHTHRRLNDLLFRGGYRSNFSKALPQNISEMLNQALSGF